MLSAGRNIVSAEGAGALMTGFGPTAVGYFIQGGGKFAGYEFWKKTFVAIAGGQENAVKYRTVIYLGGASIAEWVINPLSSPHESETCLMCCSLFQILC